MRKIWIFLLLALLLVRCVDPLEVRYHYELEVVEGDLESVFLARGETRTVRISVLKEKYMNEYATGQSFSVAAEDIRIEMENGPFEITDQRVVGRYELEFDIVVPENEFSDSRYYELCVVVEEDGEEPMWLWRWLMQDDGNQNIEYRVLSQENPAHVPLDGGRYTCYFEIHSRKIVDGEPQEWRLTDFGGMKYRYHCTATSHHALQVKQHGVGQYSFIISAAPYYMQSGREFSWRFSLFIEESDFSFVQVFLHEQDPSLKDSGADPATGYVSDYGYLRDFVL